MKTEYIYKLTCKTSTGNVDTFYVGRTNNLTRRYKKHFYNFKSNNSENKKCWGYLRKHYKITKNTFKSLIKMEILETVEYVEDKTVRLRERHWILEYNTLKKGNHQLPDGLFETKAEYDQKYYVENKDEVKERQGIKIICPICNTKIRTDGRARHNRTDKHFKLKEAQQNFKSSFINLVAELINK